MSRRQKVKSAESDLLKLLSSSAINSIGNYVFGRTLGQGTFGKVKLATHRLTGQQVAIKIVDKIHAPTVVREIETWRHMHHPSIVRLYEVLCSETRIFMVMEYCTGGEAFDYLCAHGRFDDRSKDAKRICRQIVEAVGYCHDKNFVHRDLKLENILLTEDLNVKLIDFGFTRQVNTRNLLDTYCGSVAYAAPEMISGKRYSGPQADIWSLGVIIYTLLCGYLPFDDDSESTVRRKILELDYDLPDLLSDEAKDLIQRMLKIDGAERISIDETLEHLWFRGDGDVSQTEAPTDVPSSPSLIPSTPEEKALIEKLAVAGMDVDTILTSVKTNACDQASALWYLLLNGQKPHKLPQDNASSPLSPAKLFCESTSLVQSDVKGADYLAQARKKNLMAEGRSGGGAATSNQLGRRGIIIGAMNSASNSNRREGIGRGRRRWEGKARDAGSRPQVRSGWEDTQQVKRGWIAEEPEEDESTDGAQAGRGPRDKASGDRREADIVGVVELSTAQVEVWADNVHKEDHEEGE